jgi:hypothetical protein
MKSIFASSIFLYLGDVMFVSLLLAGTGFAIGSFIRKSRRYVVLDLETKQLNKFIAWTIIVSFINLVIFKFDILWGEAAALLLSAYGAYRWVRAARRHVRIIKEM